MKFVARLEAQDGSGHFRRMTVYAPSEVDARLFIERTEMQKSWFRLTTDQVAKLAADYELDEHQVADLIENGTGDINHAGESAVWRRLSAADRANVELHRQSAPYKLVHLGPTDPPRKAKRRKAAR